MADESAPLPNRRSTYCPRHRRYFDANAGCPICWYEESTLKHRSGSVPRIQKCPACGEMSLFWYQCRNQMECLNTECKLGQSEAEY